MKLQIKPLCQRDVRWKDKKLGNSTSSIGTYGCLLTCHSMAFQAAGIQQNPDILNETYKAGGVFNKDLIDFWKVPNVFPQIKATDYADYYDIPAPVSKFYEWLDQGLPVIVLVDFDLNPSNSVQTHFIILHGYDDETRDLMCIDPWTGEEYFFKAKYGDPATFIYGHRFYSWEVSHEPTCERKLAEKTAEVQKLEELLETKSLDLNRAETELEKETVAKDTALEEERKAKSELAASLGQQKTLEGQVETLKTEVGELTGRLDTQGKELEAVKNDLEASQAHELSNIPTKKLLIYLIGRFFRKGGEQNGEETTDK